MIRLNGGDVSHIGAVFPAISFSEDLIPNAHRAPFQYTTEVCSCSATGIVELEHASQKNGIRACVIFCGPTNSSAVPHRMRVVYRKGATDRQTLIKGPVRCDRHFLFGSPHK